MASDWLWGGLVHLNLYQITQEIFLEDILIFLYLFFYFYQEKRSCNADIEMSYCIQLPILNIQPTPAGQHSIQWVKTTKSNYLHRKKYQVFVKNTFFMNVAKKMIKHLARTKVLMWSMGRLQTSFIEHNKTLQTEI